MKRTLPLLAASLLASLAHGAPPRNARPNTLTASGTTQLRYRPSYSPVYTPGVCDGRLVSGGAVALPAGAGAFKLTSRNAFGVRHERAGTLCSRLGADGNHEITTPPLQSGFLEVLVSFSPIVPGGPKGDCVVTVHDLSIQPWRDGIAITEVPIKLDGPLVIKTTATTAQPAFDIVTVLKVEREIDFELTTTRGPFRLEVRGPYPLETGNRPGTPLARASRNPPSRWQPGFYTVAVALQKPVPPRPLALLLVGGKWSAKGALDELPRKVMDAPADLPLEDRHLCAEMPMQCVGRGLELQAIPANVRQQRFASASRGLFVYAALDLDKDLATAIDGGDDFPRQDEPLLIVHDDTAQAHALAADGSLYLVKRSDLRAAPKGAAQLPARARALDITSAVKNHTISLDPKDDKVHFVTLDASAAPFVRQYKEIDDRSEKCIDRIKDKYGGRQYGSYNIVTYRQGKIAKVQNGKDRAWDEIDRVCKLEAVEKQMDALAGKMAGTWLKQRQTALDAIRASWAK